jgi:thioredoxin-dependent peroxiredoxin
VKPMLVALFLTGLVATVAPPRAAAQDSIPLAMGDTAPDFSLTAATRDGILPLAAKLRDFRGQTVVLAFFYKARTGG